MPSHDVRVALVAVAAVIPNINSPATTSIFAAERLLPCVAGR